MFYTSPATDLERLHFIELDALGFFGFTDRPHWYLREVLKRVAFVL